MNLYFHGSTAEHLADITSKGLHTRKGRATLTRNPAYTLTYAGGDEAVKRGLLVTIEDRLDMVKRSIDSEITLDEQNKVIGGWVNRFRTEQYGFYPVDNSDDAIIPTEWMVALHRFTQNYVDLLKNITCFINSGKVSTQDLGSWRTELTRYYADRENQYIELKTSPDLIANATVEGMILSVSLRSVRECYLGKLVASGWKIENRGDHPVNIKTDHKSIDTAEQHLHRLQHLGFLPQQSIEEAVKYLGWEKAV